MATNSKNQGPTAKAKTTSSAAFLNNRKTGRNYLLKPGTRTVGRKKSEILLVGDPLVSREHCQFHMQDMGLCYVEDLGSTNKTYVNSKAINAYSLILLKEGDLVQVGRQILEFRKGSPRKFQKKNASQNPIQKMIAVFQQLRFLATKLST